MADSEQQAVKAQNDVDTTKTGDVQVEDAHPQIPNTPATDIPKVQHEPDSAAPAAGNTATSAAGDSKSADSVSGDKSKESGSGRSYPGGQRFDPTALPQSDDASAIRKQVEFYFSDSNLTTDKFLYTMVSENQGWADLRTIANFKRMRRFQPFTAVVAALRESSELEVSEDGEKVKRVRELKPFSAQNSPVSRSVYVKGFPAETKTLQVDLEGYFQGYGNVNVVRLRRTDDGQFKGSVFVEFASQDEQAQFLTKYAKPANTENGSADENEGTKQEELTYEGVALECMSKKAYLEMKEQQYGGKFPQSNGKKTFNAFSKENQKSRGGGAANANSRGGRGRGRGRGAGGRGGGRNSHSERSAAGDDEKRGEKRAAEDAPTAQTEAKVAKTE